MNTYLTIMVTILVATQLIRITQNGISLCEDCKETLLAWLHPDRES